MLERQPIQDHLRAALWRVGVGQAFWKAVTSARLLVCGMGCSAIGRDLRGGGARRRASPARCTEPSPRLRALQLGKSARRDVLCSSYSGNTEAAHPAGCRGAQQPAAASFSSSRALNRADAREGVQVVGRGILRQAAVAYMFTAAAEACRRWPGSRRQVRGEVEAAADLRLAGSGRRSLQVARRRVIEEGIRRPLPVVYGASLTVESRAALEAPAKSET